MGRVFLAGDKGPLDRKVAIKLLASDALADPEAKERFVREAKLAARLDHANICSIHEYGEEDGQPFIVMQYIKGETLRARLRTNPSPKAGRGIFRYLRTRRKQNLIDLLKIAVDVATGLSAAHSQAGIIHRDIKPENIMIERSMIASDEFRGLVMDFGLAKLAAQPLAATLDADAENIPTLRAYAAGTPEYSSPEQLDPYQNRTLDHRSDIFSLGIVLYEMFTGRHPFWAPTTAGITERIRTIDPIPLITLAPHLPRDIDRITMKALQKSRDQRYQDARDLRDDLDRVSRKLQQSTRTTLWLTILSLTVISIVAIALVFRHGNKAITSIAVAQFASLGSDASSQRFAQETTEAIITNLSKSPELRVIPYSGPLGDPVEIGRRAGVGAVLSGTVTRDDGNLVGDLNLTSVSDASKLWWGHYNKKIDEARLDISTHVLENLRTSLSERQTLRTKKHGTEVDSAATAYRVGIQQWNQRTKEGLKKSIEQFKEAVRLDPTFALAYAGLANSYVLLSVYTDTPPAESFKLAEEAARSAIDFDEELAEAHSALAFALYRFQWDFSGADREFKRAIELSPDYATAHHWYGEFLLPMDRQNEGFRELQLAVSLDPQPIISADLGAAYLFAREPRRAIEQLLQTTSRNPYFAYAYGLLGQAYEQEGEDDNAIEAYKKQSDYSDDPTTKSLAQAHLFALTGGVSQVREELSKLLRKRYVPPYRISLIYIMLNQKDEALKFLEKAFEERSHRVLWLRIDPAVDPLRSDPRFAQLIDRIPFPQ
jgi:serine/threonine-protein kinase